MFESSFATTYTSARDACALVFATYLHQPNQQSRLNQWLGRVQLNQQAPLLKQGLGLDPGLELGEGKPAMLWRMRLDPYLLLLMPLLR